MSLCQDDGTTEMDHEKPEPDVKYEWMNKILKLFVWKITNYFTYKMVIFSSSIPPLLVQLQCDKK